LDYLVNELQLSFEHIRQKPSVREVVKGVSAIGAKSKFDFFALAVRRSSFSFAACAQVAAFRTRLFLFVTFEADEVGSNGHNNDTSEDDRQKDNYQSKKECFFDFVHIRKGVLSTLNHFKYTKSSIEK
jgi:hypothetical protein